MGLTYYVEGTSRELIEALDHVVDHKPTWRRMVKEVRDQQERLLRTDERFVVWAGRILAPKLRTFITAQQVARKLSK